MIIDQQTNLVYFSELLTTNPAYNKAFQKLSDILDKHLVEYQLLKDTKDIWCRDYMPIQKSEMEFVQFRYEPAYLKDDLHLQSKPTVVLNTNKIEAVFSDINLDGGNVLRWHDRVLISKRVYSENPKYSNKTLLIKDLEELFNTEVIIIPEIRNDMTGHADGLMRFVNRSTLLGNRIEDEYLYWQNPMKKIIADYKFEYIDLPFFEYKVKGKPESAFGCYTNYLEIGNLIILPVFEVRGNKDEEAIKIISDVFKDRKIETININEIAENGGLMNCISWNIKAN